MQVENEKKFLFLRAKKRQDIRASRDRTVEANLKAKLPERQQQCAEARSIAGKAWATSHHLGRRGQIASVEIAMVTFWRTQKLTRTVLRILRDLKPRVRANQ